LDVAGEGRGGGAQSQALEPRPARLAQRCARVPQGQWPVGSSDPSGHCCRTRCKHPVFADAAELTGWGQEMSGRKPSIVVVPTTYAGYVGLVALPLVTRGPCVPARCSCAAARPAGWSPALSQQGLSRQVEAAPPGASSWPRRPDEL
jgi:hypothetical protein